MKTEPAGAVTCMSCSHEKLLGLKEECNPDPAMIVRLTPGIGAVTVIPSVGPRGLRVSLCAPGTQKVPPEFSSTSVISAESKH